MRKTIVAGNWKMNNTVPDALKLIAAIQHCLPTAEDSLDVVVIPPFTAIYSVGITLQDSFLKLGAQDIFWEDAGAYTGAVSGQFLKDAGCDYVIVGHSERRQHFGDTNKGVNLKILAALRNELAPIMCVGETIAEREKGRQEEVVELQVKEGLAGVHTRDVENVVIAYEPVWAIGTGKVATNEQVQAMHAFIRNLIEKMFDSPTANKIRIIYGGSVKPSNCPEIFMLKDVDGALVGGASLSGEDFAAIVKSAVRKNL
jgi:triosephosphate isomerase